MFWIENDSFWIIKTEYLKILKVFKKVKKVNFNQLKNFIFNKIEEIEVDYDQLKSFALNKIKKPK